ncbi:Zinc metalloproteinase nas-39 [Clonorchis sinensis]|uniref:Zinc metalloproteinase nas-39 n=1 Tax=Clonorchis sinensis TaxID=79923 RepID=A0A419PST4_CLOSI|nr:Zinc metalloproteinase nas-39 [Clonorchis sinensis]
MKSEQTVYRAFTCVEFSSNHHTIAAVIPFLSACGRMQVRRHMVHTAGWTDHNQSRFTAKSTSNSLRTATWSKLVFKQLINQLIRSNGTFSRPAVIQNDCDFRVGRHRHQEIIDCYYTIERPHGIINSPNYPENYPSNANCKWTILKPEVQSILKFHDFHVEWQEDCAKDFVDIYFGTGPTTTKHGPFCNSNPPPSISFTDNVVITFQSDADIEDRGFNASYGPVVVKLAQCPSTHQVYLPLVSISDYSFLNDPV